LLLAIAAANRARATAHSRGPVGGSIPLHRLYIQEGVSGIQIPLETKRAVTYTILPEIHAIAGLVRAQVTRDCRLVLAGVASPFQIVPVFLVSQELPDSLVHLQPQTPCATI
jgi:hypothetical protein